MDTVHDFSVTSRSGRRTALLGTADMETEADELRTEGEVAARMAAVAHSPLNDRARHVALSHALEAALAACDRQPGTSVEGACLMDDGRTAVVTRRPRTER